MVDEINFVVFDKFTGDYQWRNETAEKCFDVDPSKIRKELIECTWDEQKLMRGSVKNSLARRNMCIAEVGQVADIINGKGTVIAL